MTSALRPTLSLARPMLRLLPAPVSVPPYDDEPGPRPVLRLVTTPPPAPEPFDLDTWVSPDRTPSSALPPPGPLAVALVRALVEVLAGVRSLTQLRRDTTPELYAELAGAVSRATARRGSREALRPGRNAVRSLHVQARPDGVAEVCATVTHGQRLAALALRLEGQDGRWRCTEVAGV